MLYPRDFNKTQLQLQASQNWIDGFATCIMCIEILVQGFFAKTREIIKVFTTYQIVQHRYCFIFVQLLLAYVLRYNYVQRMYIFQTAKIHEKLELGILNTIK